LEAGLPLALGSGVALLIVQQIDNHILSPNIVARTVKLHPVTVMLGLLAGGTLLGLWGMLLAVPVLATVKILLLHTWDTRMQWPPPSSEGAPVTTTAPRASTESGAAPLGGRPAVAGPGGERPSEQLRRAKEPARETERRGSWWTNAFRAVFGPRRSPREPDGQPPVEERQPERTLPGS
jgi:hypothetical protein